MIYRSQRRKQALCRPNLIPILDAVFIFIFFLLMSAQFLKIHEIGSDAPHVKMLASKQKDRRPPLNLTLEIFPNRLVIKTMAQGLVRKILPLKGKDYDFKGLQREMRAIKKHHVDENAVILKPDRSVSYKRIVKVIDVLRELPPKTPMIKAINKKGQTIQTRKLFDQVIFETII